jgi:hypothetical protein
VVEAKRAPYNEWVLVANGFGAWNAEITFLRPMNSRASIVASYELDEYEKEARAKIRKALLERGAIGKGYRIDLDFFIYILPYSANNAEVTLSYRERS